MYEFTKTIVHWYDALSEENFLDDVLQHLTFAPKTNTTKTYKTFNVQTSKILINVIRNDDIKQLLLIYFYFSKSAFLFSVSSQIPMNVFLKNLCRFTIVYSSTAL